MIIPTTSASFLLLPAIHIPFLCPFVQEPICFKKVRCGAYTGLLNSTITYFFRKGNRLPKSVIYCKVCVIFVIVHRAWKAEGKQTSSSLVSSCPARRTRRCPRPLKITTIWHFHPQRSRRLCHSRIYQKVFSQSRFYCHFVASFILRMACMALYPDKIHLMAFLSL